ncbi:MAG: CD3324 family protein [Anaerocolumna sp.]
MSYIKADNVLPQEVLELIQEYIDGGYLYIPRKDTNRKSWGETTNSKFLIQKRNLEIYNGYKNGLKIPELAEQYNLSEKSIQRIVLQEKRNDL